MNYIIALMLLSGSSNESKKEETINMPTMHIIVKKDSAWQKAMQILEIYRKYTPKPGKIRFMDSKDES